MPKTLGVATTKAEIDSGTIDGATIGATTPAAVTATNLTATGNVALGNAAADTIGLYGIAPISQRAGAAQATSLVSVTSASFATAYAAALLEVMNTLEACGLWKGAS